MAHRFISGDTLEALLRAAGGPVKLVSLCGSTTVVEPAQALAVARTGHWVGKVSATGTVRYLREIEKRTSTADTAYWDGRAALRFATDLRSTPERVKRREESARWDRLLALDPPPRSWRQ